MLNNQTCNYFKNFSGTPTLIRLVSNIDSKPGASNKTIIQQRLTVLSNGAVSFISTTKDREIAESLNFDVDTGVALSVLDKISKFFSKAVDSKRYPVVGSYDLTISNSEGISYYYDGSLNNNYTIDGENLSDYIRSALNLPQLFVFEDSGMKKELKTLKITSYTDNECVFLDSTRGELNYSCGSNNLKIENPVAIKAFFDKYNERITPEFDFSASVGYVWDYELNATYSYGKDLRIGGTKEKNIIPYFWKEMMTEIRKMIENEMFKSLFNNDVRKQTVQNNNYNHKIALVSSNDLEEPRWYVVGSSNAQINDYVLVTDDYGDYIIGKVTSNGINNNSKYNRRTYGTIIKKL